MNKKIQEGIEEFMTAASSYEGYYFENIHKDSKLRKEFLSKTCDACDKTILLFPDCFSVPNFHYLNCYLQCIKKYLNAKYKLNWMTVTLFPPNIEEQINNFNLGNNLAQIQLFYEYFSNQNKYSASKSIFINQHENILEKFPKTDIFKIAYNFDTFKIIVTDALITDNVQLLIEDPGKINFSNYVKVMTSMSGIKQLNYLYFFRYKNYNPLPDGENELFSGLYIPSEKEIDLNILKEISNFTKILLAPIEKSRNIIHLEAEFNKKIKFSMRAAMAAIMSRNGSHNIGSHVLSSVSQNFNELSDDIHLFTYIQQRMDFIPQVTTEIPEWSYPCSFVQDLMRRFYLERHLLKYICGAEGLKGYEFQKKGKVNIHEGVNDIIINVSKVNSSGKRENIIDYEQNKSFKNNSQRLKNIAQVAIPGGIVGQQAFYIILENILRNTAKHNWTNTVEKPKNLEINIDFKDELENDFVLINIWDNVSDVFKNIDIQDVNKIYAANELYFKQEGDNTKIPLHCEINEKIIKHHIDSFSGQLLKENWGLAEIKICTAFLNKIDLSELGLNNEHILYNPKKSWIYPS